MKTRKLIEAKGLLKEGDRVKLSEDNFISWWSVTDNHISNDSVKFQNEDYGHSYYTFFSDKEYIQFRDESSTDLEDLAEGDTIILYRDKEVIQRVNYVHGDLLTVSGTYLQFAQSITYLKKQGWTRVPTISNHKPETVKIGEQRFLKSDIEKLTPIV